LENFPLKIPNFSILFPQGKKISPSRVKKYLGQRWVSLLLTARQKYVGFCWDGSEPISKQKMKISKIFLTAKSQRVNRNEKPPNVFLPKTLTHRITTHIMDELAESISG